MVIVEDHFSTHKQTLMFTSRMIFISEDEDRILIKSRGSIIRVTVSRLIRKRNIYIVCDKFIQDNRIFYF